MRPIDQGKQSLELYLLRILTILVERSDGEIRIPATELIESMEGKGIVKYYDKSQKVLVIRIAPTGSEHLIIKDGDICPTDPLDPVSPLSSSSQSSNIPATRLRASSKANLRSTELMQTDLDSSMDRDNQPPARSRVLSDEALVALENQREKESRIRQAEEILVNFPSAPVTSPSRQPARERMRSSASSPVSTQSQELPPGYYRR